MIDIYCTDNRCPICDGNVEKVEIFKNDSYISCPNRCYCFNVYDNSEINLAAKVFSFSVFEDTIEFSSNDTDYFQKVMKDAIIRKIKFWKEDEKYLIKIMSG